METVNNAFIKKYVSGQRRHGAFYKTVDIYDHIRFHVNGYKYELPNPDVNVFVDNNPYFDRLIGEYRPGEKNDVMEYRKKNYVSITKRPCFKVINSLKKIVKSDDWKISYDASERPKLIVESESLEAYAEKHLPKRFKSIENWVYTFAMRQLLTDPNAVIYTLPVNIDAPENDYYQPLPFIANSDKVYEYKENELVVIESKETHTFTHKGKTYDNGLVFYVFQPGVVHKAVQIDLDKNFRVDEILNDSVYGMLAFRSGFGEICDVIDNEPVYESFISPMLPDLDKAARENSDLDASVVQHLHPLEWYVSGVECETCAGNGTIVKNGKPITCSTCGGVGKRKKSPFTDIVVKSSSLGENPIPTPPAGIVQRDTGIIEIQDKRIADHVYNALSSLNMEFLVETPLNQSGRAKEVDRDELNNFVYGVAYHLVENIVAPIYQRIIDIRYGKVITNKEMREQMQPSIVIPQRFDLLSENTIIDQLQKLNESKVDPNVISEVQTDYIQKKFADDPVLRKRLTLIFKLNPFTASTPESVNDAVLNRLVSRRDAVIYQYIEHFVNIAMTDDSDFLNKEFSEQQKIINKLADEKINELDGVIVDALKDVQPDGESVIVEPGGKSDDMTFSDAEAQAKIRGTVGGVSAIIDINRAVSSGEMSESAAETLIMKIFGFDKEVTKQMIQVGKANPNTLDSPNE